MATEWFASLSHLLAAPIALVWGVRAVRRHRGTPAATALGLFAAAAFVLLLVSAGYHILPKGSDARELVRRLDHAAIWLMIASSVQAIHTLVFEGRWRWIPPLLVWTFAAIGIALVVFVFDRFTTLGWVLLYIGVGCVGLASLIELLIARRFDIALPFAVGGFVYSLGAIADELLPFDPVLAVFGQHELFHLAVLGGIASHAALLAYLARSAAHRPETGARARYSMPDFADSGRSPSASAN
ncbi:MAG: hemolysin III family protein [Deltaproteobacteria bacterium]|nr:hemolysin III family protein [Nannocystaceae bacterium]